MEPLTEEALEEIIKIEKPNGMLAGFGGQTGLNLAMEMVHLIACQRALQANVRSLIASDELKALTLLVRG